MKYYLKCNCCESITNDFKDWYSDGQKCVKCNSIFSDVIYPENDFEIKIQGFSAKKGIWRYFDLLPMEHEGHCISAGEGRVQIERWSFLEKYAARSGIDLEVYAHRHDNNPATGTFKDLAGATISSVLKEAGIDAYCVATTGNIGVALSRYLADAGILLFVFIPEHSSVQHASEISCFGQKVFRVKGDYSRAKELASDFAKQYKIPLSPNSYDPIRIEAKKTIAYEWYNFLPKKFPTVYIQALSGGTGPLGLSKACKQMYRSGMIKSIPRFLLVQTDRCNPMAQAWFHAKATNFPEGWRNKYPKIDNPSTNIPTLATGNPGLYPLVSEIVRDSDGEIFTTPELMAPAVARLVAYEVAVRMGPAAAIAVGGFFNALHEGLLRNEDRVMLAIGEGIRRAPDFMQQISSAPDVVSKITDCQWFERTRYQETIWEKLNHFFKEK